MSKKKHKHKESVPVLKQEIPIQDDPYWKVSNLYMDAHRVGRFMIKFERFDEEYPEWTQSLLGGIPTFYCVLGVARGASEQEIKEAYEKKMHFSSFDRDIIEEAYDVLSDRSLQKKYDELLLIFEQITKCMPSSEKNDLIQTHTQNIQDEKDFQRMGVIQTQYSKLLEFYLLGAPDLYEIIGLDPESSFEEIQRKCEKGSEIFKKVFSILGDASRRDDYDFMMYFVKKFGSIIQQERRDSKTKKWEKIDRKIFEKIILLSLAQSDASEKADDRMFEIISANQDWTHYLPPNKETFFSILGIEKSSLSGDKKEIENILRDKYKHLEKTPQANLAYSVLKNESQRGDYIWLSENIDIFNALEKIYSNDEEKTPLDAGKKGKKKKKQEAKKKSPYQATFEDIENMMKKIFKMRV